MRGGCLRALGGRRPEVFAATHASCAPAFAHAVRFSALFCSGAVCWSPLLPHCPTIQATARRRRCAAGIAAQQDRLRTTGLPQHSNTTQPRRHPTRRQTRHHAHSGAKAVPTVANLCTCVRRRNRAEKTDRQTPSRIPSRQRSPSQTHAPSRTFATVHRLGTGARNSRLHPAPSPRRKPMHRQSQTHAPARVHATAHGFPTATGPNVPIVHPPPAEHRPVPRALRQSCETHTTTTTNGGVAESTPSADAGIQTRARRHRPAAWRPHADRGECPIRNRTHPSSDPTHQTQCVPHGRLPQHPRTSGTVQA